MKKALSLFLAILMIFAAMSVSASAAPVSEDEYFGVGRAANYNQAILEFDLNGCTVKGTVHVFDIKTGNWSWDSNVTGVYTMIPYGERDMIVNTPVSLPEVTPPTGYQFNGWYCYEDGNTYGANGNFWIREGRVGKFTHFRAAIVPAEYEEDTMSKVMGVLVKVFGTIIGLIFMGGQADAGIEMMQQMLGGLFN